MSQIKSQSPEIPITVNKNSEDITSVKTQLEKLQRRSELILQAAGEGIYGLDTNGHTTFVNRAAIEMVGYCLEELINKNQHDIIHHSRIDGSRFDSKDCKIYQAFSDGKVHQCDNEVFWRKDGSSFPIEYTSTPIKNDAGKILGAVVVFKDITERKESERKIKKANDDLKIAYEELTKLKEKLQQENEYLQQEIKLSKNFEEIISQSKNFRNVLKKIEQVAITDATVLILGESGTGKELIARAVHNTSNRKNSAMVKVNCAALPASLIESELFGHEKGAFTGALSKKIGRFELADGGTIFLDEVGEIPLELQPKLLRILQEGEFERIGNPRTTKVNVRVIAATNKNLKDAISNGEFREDLYYRLNVFPIEIPPLRERNDDVPLLTTHFLMKHGNKLGKVVDVVPQKTMDALVKYNWPGNVRELENVIERGIIISSSNKLDIGDAIPNSNSNPVINGNEIVSLDDNERNHIIKALEKTNWKISGENGAAELLNIKRTTLEARIKKLNIERS